MRNLQIGFLPNVFWETAHTPLSEINRRQGQKCLFWLLSTTAFKGNTSRTHSILTERSYMTSPKALDQSVLFRVTCHLVSWKLVLQNNIKTKLLFADRSEYITFVV
jgi:hypothetical protein